MAFSDDFTRADSATVGNGWTEENTSSFEILSNKLRATGGGNFSDNICYAPSGGDFADGTVQVDFQLVGGTSQIPQVHARFDEVAGDSLLAFWVSGSFRMDKMVAGSNTQLVAVSQSLSAGVNYRITFTLSGNTKTAVLRNLDTATDLQTLNESTDSTITGSGKTGVSIHTVGTVDYDNFVSTPAVTGPSMTSVDGDNQVREGQTNIAVVWSDGSASGNTLTVSPTNDINDVNAITPTITSESATGCTVTGPFSFPTGVAEGGNSFWFVTDSGAQDSASLTVVRSDLTPGAFGFTDQSDIAVSTLITSDSITVTGIDDLSPISISGGEYEINTSGTWVTAAGTVSNGDTVRVRHTSSASNSTATNTTLTIGGVQDIFTSTTVAAALAFDMQGAANVFKNNTSTALTSRTGVVADVYLTSTGDRVGARKTGLATDASGNLGNISDANYTSAAHDLIVRFTEGEVALIRGKTPA